MVLMRGVQNGTLYKILGIIDIDKSANMVCLDFESIYLCLVKSFMLWHQKMGHISEKGLHAIHSKGMVKGILDFAKEVEFCEHVFKVNRDI